MFGKQKVASIVAEFLGAAVLASVILSMMERTTFPFFAAVAAGITYATWWLITGAFINPAVTLALWTVRRVRTTQALVFIAAQALGGLVAWRLNEYLQNSPLAKVSGKNVDWRVITAETLGTLILSIGVAAAVSRTDSEYKRFITVAGAAVLGTLVASFAALGLLNPAVAIGVRAINDSYIAAPFVGALVGVNLYVRLFAPVAEDVSREPLFGRSNNNAIATSKPGVKKTPTKSASVKNKIRK